MKLELNDLITYKKKIQFFPSVELNAEGTSKFPVLHFKVQTKVQFFNNWISREATVPKREFQNFILFFKFLFNI